MILLLLARLAEVRAVEANITLLHGAAAAAGPAAVSPQKPVPLAVLCEQQQQVRACQLENFNQNIFWKSKILDVLGTQGY